MERPKQPTVFFFLFFFSCLSFLSFCADKTDQQNDFFSCARSFFLHADDSLTSHFFFSRDKFLSNFFHAIKDDAFKLVLWL